MLKFIFLFATLIVFSGCKSLHHCKANEEDVECSSGATINKTRIPIDKSIIKGTVTDCETGEPIPFSEVILQQEGHILARISDEYGNYEFKDIPYGIYTLSFSSSSGGYEHFDMHVDLELGYNVQLDVHLKEEIILLEKPVIYIYPEKDTTVSVKLNYDGEIIHSYPEYPDSGWTVKAQADGTLWDKDGKSYYALFWEGKPDAELFAKDGFVVKGSETAAFLEEKLAYLGLNRREANEFIMYWLPRMESYPYNFIHFAGKTYEEMAELIIDPKPETLIRVMMLTLPLQHNMHMPEQDLSPLKKERKGYTVVEWGGSVLNATTEVYNHKSAD
jgi:hypothetical protein